MRRGKIPTLKGVLRSLFPLTWMSLKGSKLVNVEMARELELEPKNVNEILAFHNQALTKENLFSGKLWLLLLEMESIPDDDSVSLLKHQ